MPQSPVNVNDPAGMATRKLFTLIFLKRNNTVLLGRKTRGLGEGLWNGFGGKLEPNETILTCAKRELKEEANLVAAKLKHLGVVRYQVDTTQEDHIVHVFTSSEFHGDEAASEEMDPIRWYKFGEIPYEKMWPDSKDWYPLMLQDKFFSAHVFYGSQGKIREKIIKEHDDLNRALEISL